MASDPNSDPEQPWYLQRWALISGAFLLAVTLAGVILVTAGPAKRPATSEGGPDASRSAPAPSTEASSAEIATRQPPSPDRPGPVTSAAPPSSRPDLATSVTLSGSVAAKAADATSPSVCGLAAGSPEVPVAPPTATWAMVGGTAAPQSASFGPGVVTGGIGNCYQHSATGALFAAMDTLALTNASVSQIDPVQVVRQRATPAGSGYAQALASAERAVAAQTGQVMPDDSSTAVHAAFLGFQYVDYTPARAVIQLAIGIGDPLQPTTYKPVIATVVMAWQAGDWRYIYDLTGPPPQPILFTTQYIKWSA